MVKFSVHLKRHVFIMVFAFCPLNILLLSLVGHVFHCDHLVGEEGLAALLFVGLKHLYFPS